MSTARKILLSLSVIAGCNIFPWTSFAQSYPTKPIRLIVPFGPGGSPDITSRYVMTELSRQIGQQVVVDNRVGASGIIGTELIARAAPDGYTLGLLTFPFGTSPSLFAKLPYDSVKDFQPVVSMLVGVNLLAVSPSLPVRSVKELIEHARKNPDKLTYAGIGGGATNTLGMELFKMMSGTRLMLVSYKALQQAYPDVAAGRVDVICENLPAILPHVKEGRVRGIAVTAKKRSFVIPDLPTVDEAGVPGFEIVGWSGYAFPARVPRDLVMKLNAEINKALNSQFVQDRFAAVGYTPAGGTPEQFTEFIRAETAKWAKVIKAAGINPQ